MEGKGSDEIYFGGKKYAGAIQKAGKIDNYCRNGIFGF